MKTEVGNILTGQNELPANCIVIREAKWNSFREFCEAILLTKEGAQLHKAIAEDRAICSDCLKKKDGTLTQNEEGRVHLLPRTHFPG